jgi:hypothetical protein
MPATLAAVALPVFTLTTAALADDDKTYPGAMCRLMAPAIFPTNLSQIGEVIDRLNAFAIGLDTNGAMLNFSQVDQAWICPVVRDSMESDPAFARITVKENKTAQVECKFEARDSFGENLKTSSAWTRKVEKTFPLHLIVTYTWGTGDDDALDDVSKHGYYYFMCVVPGRFDPTGGGGVAFSGVITYKVGEK